MRHLGVQLVHLLQTQTLGLVDQRVYEECADGAEGAPDVEDLGLEVGVARAVVHQVGRGIRDGPVE